MEEIVEKKKWEWIKNHCDGIIIEGEKGVFGIPNGKWVDRHLCEYSEDGEKYYVVLYSIFDNTEEKLYFEDGYMSHNFEEMKEYYITLFKDLDGIVEEQ